MCGLVGIYGKDMGVAQGDVFHQLLHTDSLRGEDSTGICLVGTQGEKIFKELGGVNNLYFHNWRQTDALGRFSLVSEFLAMGHNRAATKGLVNRENAHPFKIGDIIGCHNGTVSDWDIVNFEGYEKYEVDSQIIFSELNKTKDIQSIWSNVEGAMTLTWWDSSDRTFNIASNGKRPFSYVIDQTGKTFYYASEDWMLYGILKRNNVKFDGMYDLTPNVHYKLSFDEEDLVRIQKTVLTPYVEKPFVFRNRGGYQNSKELIEFYIDTFNERSSPVYKDSFSGYTDNGMFVTVHGVDAENDPLAQSIIDDLNTYSSDDVFYGEAYLVNYGSRSSYSIVWKDVSIRDDVVYESKERDAVGYNNEFLDKEEFLKRVNQLGCVNCSQPIKWEQRETVRWLTREDVACPDCKNLEVVNSLAA